MTETIRINHPANDDPKRLAEEQSRIAEIGRIVGSTLDVTSTYPKFARQARELVSADRMVIAVFSNDESELIEQFADGFEVEDSYPGVRYPSAKDDIYEHIFVNKLPLLKSGQELAEYKQGEASEDIRRDAGLAAMLLVPLIWQEHSYGVLTFRAVDANAFDTHAVELAQQIANQIAGAIASSRQYAQLERESREREQLAEIKDTVGSTLDIDEIFDKFTEQTSALVPVDRLVLTAVDLTGDVIAQCVGGLEINEKSPTGSSLTIRSEIRDQFHDSDAYFLRNGEEYEQYVLEEPGEVPRYAAGLRSILSLAMVWRGEFVGSLTFRSKDAGAYSSRDIDLAKQIADQIASAVHASNQYRLLEGESLRREHLAEIGRIVSSTLDLDKAFDAFASAAKKLVAFDRLAISIVDSSTGEISDAYISGRAFPDSNMTGPYSLEDSAVPEQTYRDHKVTTANSKQLLKLSKSDSSDDNRERIANGLVSAMFVPVVLQGTLVGALVFRSQLPDPYGELESRLAEQIAAHLAGIIASSQQRNLLLAESAERRRLADEQGRIAEIGRIVSSTLDLDEVFSRFVEESSELLPFDRIAIITLSDDKKSVIDSLVDGIDSKTAAAGAVMSINNNLLQKKALTEGVEVVLNGEEYLEVANTVRSEKARADAGLVSVLMAPMLWQGEVIGVINFRSKLSDAYGDHQVDIAKQISAQIAGAVAVSKQYTQLRVESAERRRLGDEQRRIAEIGRIVGSTLDLDDVFSRVVEETRELVPFDRLVIILLNEDKDTLINSYVDGIGADKYSAGERRPVGFNPQQEQVLTTGKPFVLNGDEATDTADDIAFEEHLRALGLKSVLVAPLVWQQDVFGLLAFRSKEDHPYGEHEIELADQVSAQIAGAVATSTQYKQLRREAAERETQASIALRASQSLGLEELYSGLASDISALVPFTRLTIMDVALDEDSRHGELTVVFVSGETSGYWKLNDPHKIEWSVEDSASENGTRPLTWEDLIRLEQPIDRDGQSEVPKFHPRSEEYSDSSWVQVPIGVPDQTPTALLALVTNDGYQYTISDQALLMRIAAQLSPAISNARAHALLEESEASYRNLVENSHILVWQMNAQGQFTYVNKALESTLGYSASELLGSSFSEFQPERVRKDSLQRFKERPTIAEFVSRETVYRNKNGSEVQLLYNSSPILNDDGEFIGLRGTALDVTAEREAQDELKIQTAALEDASDAIVVLLPDTTIGYVNSAFVEQTGYSRSEAFGKPSSILRASSSADATYEKIWETVRKGNIWRGTIFSRRKDGSTFAVDASLNPVLAEDGTLAGYVSIRRDVTERIQAEQDRQARAELDAQNQQLQQMNNERDQFFSSVSHELRTPLTAVTAFSDILSRNRDGNLTSGQLDQLDVIRRNSRSLINLVEDMLDMSRLNSRSLRIDRLPFDVNEMIRSTVESLEPTARERSQTIETDLGSEGMVIDADRGRIIQVLSNLITNACKYSPPASGITVTSKLSKTTLEIQVVDSGYGMSKADQSMLFSPFYRSDRDEIRTQTGTGLGMSISKTLVELHDGEIDVESAIDQGTTVTITLPGASEGDGSK